MKTLRLLALSLALLTATLATNVFFGAGQAQAACSALPSAKGTVAVTISVPSSGAYRVWARELAPTSSANGFYLQIADAGACQVTMGHAAIPVNTWTWVDYQNGNTTSKVSVTLNAGSHAVNLAGLDDSVQVDKIILLSDTSCTPTGDGSNCTAPAVGTPTPTASSSASSTPTAVPISSSGGSSSTPTVSNTISIPVPAGSVSSQCFIDGKEVTCSSIDTTKLSDGKHTIVVKSTDAKAKITTQTTTINVKNKLTPQEQLIKNFQRYRPWSWIITVLIIAVPLLLFLGYRFGLLRRLMDRLNGLGPDASPSPLSPPSSLTPPFPASSPAPPSVPPLPPPPSAATPPPGPVYPEGPNPDNPNNLS